MLCKQMAFGASGDERIHPVLGESRLQECSKLGGVAVQLDSVYQVVEPLLIRFVRKRGVRSSPAPFRMALKYPQLPRARRKHEELPWFASGTVSHSHVR